MCLMVLMMASCKKDPEMPSGEFVNIKTNEVTDVTAVSAVVSAYVGAGCDERGVCWSESANPMVSNSHTTNGSGIGGFTSNITGLTANTTYYVRAYATNSKGTSYGEQKSFTTNGIINGHEYVDLGLPSGLLWATCNVGGYYAWGETTTKSYYNWNNYKWCNGSRTTLTKYNTTYSYGTVDKRRVLEPEDDAAHVNWGGGWRMPTSAEFDELYDNTACTWTIVNGVKGQKLTSKTDSSKYIFLGATFHDGSVWDASYWSSSLCSSIPCTAYNLVFGGRASPQANTSRYEGLCVRPVCAAR